jgi:hypothetical protein
LSRELLLKMNRIISNSFKVSTFVFKNHNKIGVRFGSNVSNITNKVSIILTVFQIIINHVFNQILFIAFSLK